MIVSSQGCQKYIVFVSPAKHSSTYRDNFVQRLSVCLCVCLCGSHTVLVVMHSYVLQATCAFLGMLPLCYNDLIGFPLFSVSILSRFLVHKRETVHENPEQLDVVTEGGDLGII